MQAHPLIPPHIAPGCWPQATDEEKKAALYQIKQARWMNAGIESCVSKGVLAGVAGESLHSAALLFDGKLTHSVSQKFHSTREFAFVLDNRVQDSVSVCSSHCSHLEWHMTRLWDGLSMERHSTGGRHSRKVEWPL
jgi:hypothetical protein